MKMQLIDSWLLLSILIIKLQEIMNKSFEICFSLSSTVCAQHQKSQ